MKDSRNTKAEEMKRQTERNILEEEGGKEHFGGFSGGEITQMSLKASMTVFCICVHGGRQTDGRMDTKGVVAAGTENENVRFQNRANECFLRWCQGLVSPQ